jgi:hypothetical protein
MAINIDRITESTATRATSRIAAIMIVPVLGIVGWLAINMLSDIKENQKAFWGQVGKINTTLSAINTNLSVANANFSNHVHDDDSFDGQIRATIADHEMRLRSLQTQPRHD